MTETKPETKIDHALMHRRVLITCGTGGVGKTTLSAAMAIRAALLGKRTVVITIDPAKRLANSLGLATLTDQPTDLTPQIRAAYEKAKSDGHAVPAEMTGSLVAIVPDTRRTFENFVTELAPRPEIAEKVMKNPIFQIFAKEFSGTNEYMALERLLALYKQSDYDCIILDTPPSRNTLAFLEAPRLLAQFFDEKIIRWLILPTNKLVSAGMKSGLGILEKLTGAGFMTHLFEFAASLFEVQVNFTANLKKITAILESPQVGFIMVTTPTLDTGPDIRHFLATLQEHHFHFDGVALNRTFSHLKPIVTTHDETNPKNQQAYAVIQALQERERHVISILMKNPIPVCAKLPELARDVHSVEDLFHVAMAFGAASGSSSDSPS